MRGDQLDSIRREANAENQKLRDEMAASVQKYTKQIAEMEETFKSEMDVLARTKDQGAHVSIFQNRVEVVILNLSSQSKL